MSKVLLRTERYTTFAASRIWRWEDAVLQRASGERSPRPGKPVAVEMRGKFNLGGCGTGLRLGDGETRSGSVLPASQAAGLSQAAQDLCSSCQRQLDVTQVMAAWENGGAFPAPLGKGTIISLGWRDVIVGINADETQQAISVPRLPPGTSLAYSCPAVWGVLWALGNAAFLLPPVKKSLAFMVSLSWLEFHKLRLFQPHALQLS